ncbi:hypothetical protein ECHJAX_0080 [Ehrlichia chaffeensis str. Jax]|nr:hypothetical protein ECHJAX_0080 [Ehrlichia chaffeensis str. Jax]
MQSLYLSIKENSSPLYPSTYVVDVTIEVKKTELLETE